MAATKQLGQRVLAARFKLLQRAQRAVLASTDTAGCEADPTIGASTLRGATALAACA